MAHALELKDDDLQGAMQHCLSVSLVPANSAGFWCRCASFTTAADGDHAMTTYPGCFAKSLTVPAWPRRWNQLHRLPCLEARTTATGVSRLGALGDVLAALESGITVVDVMVTHPLGQASLFLGGIQQSPQVIRIGSAGL
jgi:hypothetical protein